MNNLIYFFLFLAVVSWGAGAFFDKMTLKYLNPNAAFFGRTFVMLVLFVPLLAARFSLTSKELAAAAKISWLYLFLSVLVTMSGVFFYLKAMSAGEASKIVPLSSIYPLVTFFLAWLFLGESINISKFSGAVLISFGIYLVTR